MEFIYNDTSNFPAVSGSLSRLLSFSAAASNRLSQSVLDDHGLLLAQWVVLSALWQKNGLLISELAKYSGSNAPAASRIVDRMEKNGVVRRRNDKSDRRSIRVFLTPKGSELSRLIDVCLRVDGHLLDGFTDDEKLALTSMLERVVLNARAAKL